MEQETKEQRPYIFVSYSSKDKDKVLPIAEEIERQGYNVWVDSGNDGIAGGDVLARTIEERIQNCGVFIPFLSENYYASKWCIQELTYANSLEKPMIPVKLDSTELGSGLGVLLGAYRFLQYRDTDSLISELRKNGEFEKCRGNPVTSPKDRWFRRVRGGLRGLGNRLRPKHPKRLIASLLFLLFLLGIPCGWYAVKFGTGPIWWYENTKTKIEYFSTENGYGFSSGPDQGILTISKSFFSDSIPDYCYKKGASWNPPPWVKEAGTAETVVIKHGITSIGESAFEDFAYMNYVNIPETVKKIENRAFNGCTALKNIDIPRYTNAIGGEAFSGCTALESITIPDFVEWLGYGTFSNCTALEKAVISHSLGFIDVSLFAGCTALKSIDIPDNIGSIAMGAFLGCTALESINIPDSVSAFGPYAFSGCTSLEFFSIPDKVRSIREGVFSGCTALKSVYIPEGVDNILDDAFSRCTALNNVDIPYSVTRIDAGAFSDCINLKTVTIHRALDMVQIVDTIPYPRDILYIAADAFPPGTTVIFNDTEIIWPEYE